MAQSKALRPEWLPAVALSSALALLMLIWSPPVGDLAAQVFRTELFQRAGMAIWNGSWYGGHYTLTYSVLFPPLAALLGPQLVGTALGRLLLLPLRPPGARPLGGGGALGDALVRRRRRHPARRRPAHLRPRGRLRARPRCAACRSGAAARSRDRSPPRPAALASPVAGAFLAGVVGRRRAGTGPAGQPRSPLGAAALALVLTVAPNLAFPEPGQLPLRLLLLHRDPALVRGGALPHPRPAGEERQLRRVIARLPGGLDPIWLVPNALGGNAVRLGALFGGPVLAAVVLSRRPRLDRPALVLLAVLVVTLVGSLYWQLTASVTQIARSRRRPLDHAPPTSSPPRTGCGRTGPGRCGSRCRRPRTTGSPPTWRRSSSSPAAGCASSTPPATTSSTTKASSPTRLQRLAARQRDLLRRPARRAARLLLGRRARADPRRPLLPDAALHAPNTGGSTKCGTRSRWSTPLGAGRARPLWVGRQGFALDVTRPGGFLVRVNFTPYWSIAPRRRLPARRGDWTVARTAHPGVFRVDADFSLGGAWNAVTGARKTC